jgi:hypothetical protein
VSNWVISLSLASASCKRFLFLHQLDGIGSESVARKRLTAPFAIIL